jgi:dihydroorotate dehydrogenase
MWKFLRRLLFWLDAERAHGVAVAWLRLRSRWLRLRPRRPRPTALTALGQSFANPLGLAAGFDKGYVVPEALFELGFGFVEIGTITPRPQLGNEKPRLFRLPQHQALINRMGFNNPGADAVAARMARVRHRAGPVWLNIGKNKDTPAADAADDYVRALRTLYPHGDAFVINVSSPNTPGLRDLQAEAALRPLLTAITGAAAELGGARPLLLKIAPDLADDALPGIVELAVELGLSGLIATNTTIARPVTHPLSGEAGGFSGPALRPRATEVLQQLSAAAKGRLLLVGVGGVGSAADVREKLTAGATLVQLYTSLIYGGPAHVKNILHELSQAAPTSADLRASAPPSAAP